ncbi:MAG: hypothetical protein U0Q08_05835 [Dermatophilaceae bacterium]
MTTFTLTTGADAARPCAESMDSAMTAYAAKAARVGAPAADRAGIDAVAPVRITSLSGPPLTR